ncbi:MAG: helix-turn-helix domain-containing protein [Ramlibacter sp.]|jgi:HTH-type transcriptional regulator/antitoxin HigA|nr:helix-turn-helix domain-containing protein [Ramlibacter sp.]
MNELNLSYRPASVSPPGDTLAELIEERGIAQAELARRMGRPLNAINEIVLGGKEITEDTALELERVLGTPAHFWLARESRYREYLARQRDAGRAGGRLDWLDLLPLKQLQEAGHLPAGRLTPAFKASLIEPALRFFGVASPEGWQEQYGRVQAAFRRANPTKQTDNAAITAWLRLGELEAIKVDLPAYNAKTLEDSIPAMRALTTQPPTEIGSGLISLCAKAGVLLAFVPPFPGTHVSGVARWLADRPLIQLSLLGKWNDVFWFSFFHEVAHILKHPKRAVFLDDASSGVAAESREEKEANQFAADVLIPPAAKKRLAGIDPSELAIKAFAQGIEIHPGIVVGNLQYLGIVPYASPLTRLKARYELKTN